MLLVDTSSSHMPDLWSGQVERLNFWNCRNGNFCSDKTLYVSIDSKVIGNHIKTILKLYLEKTGK